ncbi:MAG TPA: glycoside hydrolase [Verrucomicrobiae bacterium]|nr:glycoside hydrolase [Verrucomicrobiae bacterium]
MAGQSRIPRRHSCHPGFGGILLAVVFMAAMDACGRSFDAAQVPHDAIPAFTSDDGALVISAWADFTASGPANLGQAGNWLGVTGGNHSAIDGSESVTIQFATNASLFRIGHIWTRSKVIISGFASDPGFVDAHGQAKVVNYQDGTLTYVLGWDAGAERIVTFTNPGASAGRTLRINVQDAMPGWQATITRIDYGLDGVLPATVGLRSTAQMIDNFSASDAWSMQNAGLWSDSNRVQVADLLFTTNNGIGLSAWRFNLNAGFDPAVQPGNRWQLWRTGEGFLVASNQYDWTRQAGQRWFLAAAKERGIREFIAMAYSAPTNFTRNGRVFGTEGLGSSNLKPGFEPAFARYLADIVAHFRTNADERERVAFNYLMPVNEPYWDWNGNSQEGSRYSNPDIIELAQALHPALRARSLDTEILLAEAGDLPGLYALRQDISGKYGEPYGNYLGAFDSITNLISHNLSAHSYFTENPTNLLVAVRATLRQHMEAKQHFRFWQTEYCILGPNGPGRDLTMTTALNVARVVWADLSIANAAAWHWWLSLSQADYKDGLLYTDWWQAGDIESLYCSKNFWAFGQWSRFIRPGWRRVEMPGFEDVFGLMGAAFIEPETNSVALVFVNHSNKPYYVAPEVGKVAFWSAWVTSAATSDNLSPLPPVAAEAMCIIPPSSVVTLVGNVSGTAPPHPVISGISDLTMRAGESLTFQANVACAGFPAALINLSVFSDNPALLASSRRLIVTNSITREFYVNFSGTNLAHLAAAPRFPNEPHARHSMISFETPENLGGVYGTRVRGFVVPPQDGEYTFWIASRDASELFLGSDENPATKTRIAFVSVATEPRQWTQLTTQESAPIRLQAGRRYYVEAVHVGHSSGDHLAVGWRLPDGRTERPIPGKRLSPWTDPFAETASFNVVLSSMTNAGTAANLFIVARVPGGIAVTNEVRVTLQLPGAISPNLRAEVGDGEVHLSWPRKQLGWVLEAQTNPLSAGLGNHWTPIATSSVTNHWSLSMDLNNPAVFYRLSEP